MLFFEQLADLSWSILLLLLLLGASAAGHMLLPRLPERHRSRETLDTVRLVSSLVVTFAVLVLGLLTASVNSAFVTAGNDMNALAGSIRQTETCLKSYGPEAQPIRGLLRDYTASAIASTWPEEAPPSGIYPIDERTGQKFESLALSDALQQARMNIASLRIADSAREALAEICASDFNKLSDNRWKLIGEAHRSISIPFYRLLAFMLATVFLSFGLSAPRNALAMASICLAAGTIAAAVFVLVELDGPLDGLLKVSSASMRETLEHFDR